jgi:uncharacterized lipoprotein YmbA
VNKLLIIIACALLCSCASKQDLAYVPVPVNLPVPNLLAEPNYPKIAPNASPSDFVRWCLVTVKLAKSDASACRIQNGE